MSHASISTYIYRIERIDPQAKPFASELDSIVQSNGLSKLSRVSELAGTAWGKNPFEKRIIITSTLYKNFPQNRIKSNKLFDKFNISRLAHKYFPIAQTQTFKSVAKNVFHDVPQNFSQNSNNILSILSHSSKILLSKIRILTQLHISKNLPVSPISLLKSFPVVTKVFI